MGDEMTKFGSVMVEGGVSAARACDDFDDFVAIGVGSVLSALQAQHWHSFKRQAVNFRGAQ